MKFHESYATPGKAVSQDRIQMKHKHIYNLLKKVGHSPAKAAEILLDAQRGDRFSIDWIHVLYMHRHNS